MAKRNLPRGVSHDGDQYRVRVSYEARQYTIGRFDALGDAKAALAIARSEIATRSFVPNSARREQWRAARKREEAQSVTVASFAETWLDALERDDRSAGTLRTYRSTLKVHVLGSIGTRRLIDVTTTDVTQLLNAIPTRGARDNAARTLRSMFLAAVRARAGGLTESPVRVRIEKDARHIGEIDEAELPTADDVRALVDAMPEHLRIAVLLGAWGAARQGEVLGLQRRDFDGLTSDGETTMTIRRQWNSKSGGYSEPKAGSRRRVALPSSIAPALVEHLRKFVPDEPNAPLLPSPQDPTRPRSQTSFDLYWREARDHVRPGTRFHDLRHVGLTEFARQGATTAEIAARGGHRSASVAARYQHASRQRDRVLADRLNETIGAAE